MKISRADKRRMELLNLTYKELQALKISFRLEAVKRGVVVFAG